MLYVKVRFYQITFCATFPSFMIRNREYFGLFRERIRQINTATLKEKGFIESNIEMLLIR